MDRLELLERPAWVSACLTPVRGGPREQLTEWRQLPARQLKEIRTASAQPPPGRTAAPSAAGGRRPAFPTTRSSALSVLAVELLPEVNRTPDSPGGDLGSTRVLRASRLVPAPPVCVQPPWPV